jgi:hypothetical protein
MTPSRPAPYRPLHGFRAQSTLDPSKLRGNQAEAAEEAAEVSEVSVRMAQMLARGLPIFDARILTPIARPRRTLTGKGRIVMLEERTPISDQGGAGSCTAHGRCDALELVMPKDKVVQLGRRDVYWRSRWETGDQDEDSGSWSHVSAAVVTHVGVSRETLWPYSDKPADIVKRPPLGTWLDAARHQVPEGAIQRIVTAGKRRISQVMTALDLGCPVTIDADVGDDFCNGPDPELAVFAPTTVVGGHCFILCGYWERSDGNIWLRGRNSWGSGWCDDGYCWLDASYVADADAVEDLDVTSAAPVFLDEA